VTLAGLLGGLQRSHSPPEAPCPPVAQCSKHPQHDPSQAPRRGAEVVSEDQQHRDTKHQHERCHAWVNVCGVPREQAAILHREAC
jgi:hypothetical protein